MINLRLLTTSVLLSAAGCFTPNPISSSNDDSSGGTTDTTTNPQTSTSTSTTTTTTNTNTTTADSSSTTIDSDSAEDDTTMGLIMETGSTTSSSGSSSSSESTSSSSGSSSESSSESSSGGPSAECGDGLAEAGELCFAPAFVYVETACPPERLAVGDRDLNGHLDVAFGALDDSEIGTALGDGDGGFGFGPQDAVGPSSVVLGNFDDAPGIDLAYGSVFEPEIRADSNDGNGTIVNSPVVVGDVRRDVLVVGDLNNDGLDDILGAGGPSFGITIVSSSTDGLAAFDVTANTSGVNTTSVAVGDFNGNPSLDYAYTFSSGINDRVTACLGNGQGSSTSCTSFDVGDEPIDLAVGDINGDEDADIVTANLGDESITVLLGSGNGSFSLETTIPTLGPPVAIGAWDLTNDGTADIVVAVDDAAGGIGQAVQLFVSDPGAEPNELIFDLGERRPTDLAAADFNEDGIVDVIVGSRQPSSMPGFAILLSDV